MVIGGSSLTVIENTKHNYPTIYYDASGFNISSLTIARTERNYEESWQVLNSTYSVKFRRQGNIVNLVCWNNTARTWSANFFLGTLPEGYRPTTYIFIAAYGSYYNNEFFIRVDPTGDVWTCNSKNITNSLLFNSTFIVA